MDWLMGTFFSNPITTTFLVVAIYVSLLVFLFPRGTKEQNKATHGLGLKPITINLLSKYLNRTTCACIKSRFDGSGFNEPVIEDIFTGKYNGLTVTLFSLVLPTGRTGTRQTVVHLRSDTGWLPMFSVIDEVYGKRISAMLRCDHTLANPLLNPRFIKRNDEADKLRATLARKQIPDTSIAGMKSPLNGVVIDSTGEDLFFYRHGVIEEPTEYKAVIDRAIRLREMINSGNMDFDLFRYGRKQQAMNLYQAAKGLLITCPGILLIMLVGYGYIRIPIAFGALCLAFFVYARLRVGRSATGLNDD